MHFVKFTCSCHFYFAYKIAFHIKIKWLRFSLRQLCHNKIYVIANAKISNRIYSKPIQLSSANFYVLFQNNIGLKPIDH